MERIDIIKNRRKKTTENREKLQIKEVLKLGVIEDNDDLTFLEKIAERGTKKGYERAETTASFIMIVQQGELIKKRAGKANHVISKHEERTVVVGDTSLFDV